MVRVEAAHKHHREQMSRYLILRGEPYFPLDALNMVFNLGCQNQETEHSRMMKTIWVIDCFLHDGFRARLHLCYVPYWFK